MFYNRKYHQILTLIGVVMETQELETTPDDSWITTYSELNKHTVRKYIYRMQMNDILSYDGLTENGKHLLAYWDGIWGCPIDRPAVIERLKMAKALGAFDEAFALKP